MPPRFHPKPMQSEPPLAAAIIMQMAESLDAMHVLLSLLLSSLLSVSDAREYCSMCISSGHRPTCSDLCSLLHEPLDTLNHHQCFWKPPTISLTHLWLTEQASIRWHEPSSPMANHYHASGNTVGLHTLYGRLYPHRSHAYLSRTCQNRMIRIMIRMIGYNSYKIRYQSCHQLRGN